MSKELFDKTCTDALGEYWSDYTSESEDKSLKKLYAHMQKRITELEKSVSAMGYTAQAALNQGTSYYAEALMGIIALVNESLPPIQTKEGGADDC